MKFVLILSATFKILVLDKFSGSSQFHMYFNQCNIKAQIHKSLDMIPNQTSLPVLLKLQGIWYFLVFIVQIIRYLGAWDNIPFINPRRNNTEHHHIQDNYKKFLQHKRETYNDQNFTGIERAPLLSAERLVAVY